MLCWKPGTSTRRTCKLNTGCVRVNEMMGMGSFVAPVYSEYLVCFREMEKRVFVSKIHTKATVWLTIHQKSQFIVNVGEYV